MNKLGASSDLYCDNTIQYMLEKKEASNNYIIFTCTTHVNLNTLTDTPLPTEHTHILMMLGFSRTFSMHRFIKWPIVTIASRDGSLSMKWYTID